MTEQQFRHFFQKNSDCYADTWHSERGFMEEGEVIQAMTENKFIELLYELNIISLMNTEAIQKKLNEFIEKNVTIDELANILNKT